MDRNSIPITQVHRKEAEGGHQGEGLFIFGFYMTMLFRGKAKKSLLIYEPTT